MGYDIEWECCYMRVDVINDFDLVWGVEVAAVRMLTEEVKRPELVNREHLYNLVQKIIQDGTAIVAYNDEDKPVGCIAGVLVPNLFNPQINTLAEIIWYILPEYRGTRIAAMLLKRYTELAEEIADEATLSLLPSSNVNFRSLAKRGWKQEEFAFRREINGSN